MENTFSHIADNNLPQMVDVSKKQDTLREAIAEAIVVFPENISFEMNQSDYASAKGPIFATSIIAGTMAVKNTSNLIPFCHPLQIEGIKITIEMTTSHTAQIICKAKCFGKTGIEMEVLTGASVCALTIIDMCKAKSSDIEIHSIRLLSKTGGKSNYAYSK